MARPLTPEEFATECQRRLLDRHEVMNHLGIRSRETITIKVDAGTLPAPILVKANALSLWDRDSLPDRKEA